MSNLNACFIEPLDALFLRGNKLFGDPGSYGESLIPPWPSVVAGALRSRILVDDGVDLAQFAQSKVMHATLGTPNQPGSFTLAGFYLARRFADGRSEVLMAPPADLVLSESDNGLSVRRQQPTPLVTGLQASAVLPLLPVLPEQQRGKPTGGYWLTATGWDKYLNGITPIAEDFVKSGQLWGVDHRVGVGLNMDTRTTEDGKLFSMQAVMMRKAEHFEANGFDVGFIAVAQAGQLPSSGMVRFGGDGRGAALHDAEALLPQANYIKIAQQRQCRIVLTSPAVFAQGWKLPSVGNDGRFSMQGVTGKLVCAAVPRYEVASGWDVAQQMPKNALRVAPAGSVYWLDELDATEESLGKLVANGLWDDSCQNAQRRSEGFNRLAMAAY